MLKKVAIVFGVLIVLFVITAVAVPMFVDVDKYRPQIVQAANQHLNGELKLGKLELSLWGGIKVRIESISLHGKGHALPLLETKSAYVDVPILPVLMMHPSVIVVLEQPKMNVIKDKTGKLNWLTLMPDTATPPPATPAKAADAGGGGIPGIAANASLGLRIDKAVVSYVDEVSGNKVLLDGMEVNAKHLGLKDTMDIALTLPLEGKAAGADFGGDILATAQITPVLADGNVRSASGKVTVNGDDFHFTVGHGMIEKTAKTPLRLEAEFTGSPTDVQIKNMNFTFASLSVGGKGTITLQPAIAAKLDIQSSNLDLSSLAAIVPMLKTYQLGGAATLAVHVEGPSDALAINGNLGVSGGKVADPSLLKAPINYEMKAAFTKSSLTLSQFQVTGPGLDVSLKGDVQNFSAPKFAFALNGKDIDMDKFMVKPPEAAPTAKEAKKSEAPAAPPVMENPLLPLAKVPAVRDANGVITANITKLVAKGAPITDISAKATLKDMELNVENASLKAFDGTLAAKFAGDLKSPGLKFSTSGLLKGLNSKNAITAFMPKYQNTLEAKVGGKWSLTGAAYPQPKLLHNLNGTVNITAENGRLKTIDMNESIKGVMAKLPFLKSANPPTIDQGFRSMRADLKFAGGTIDANPLEIIGNEKGVNIKGKSRIQEDLSQDTYIDVYDPNKVLPKELANGKDAVLQLHITGLATSPQTDYGYTTGRLAKNVARNQGKDLLNQQLQKALGGKVDSGKTGDAINGALKKLGF